ncbi:ribonuclease H2 subunit B isoform X1 [Macadamia integrifolia]|uniref:ribonuclease H2 subunit B isoform X1 n=1 Tax=Macadamia integrifolia TaxID=60698 RepID=UPI001C4EE219|nr:ribonuclease H2 subunit B isoform X1 [Macadamia integrifolia]
MAWRDGFEETRVLIAPVPGPSTTIENGKGTLLSLRHPKSGNPACYFFVNNSLQEFHWFKQSYGSWFLGDSVCEDGGLHCATPVDPVFILLPIFEDARMKKGHDQGKFRQLDEIMFVSGYPGYQHLLSITEDSMKVVCEIKEMGSLKFYRLDDSKVLSWLCHKVHQLKTILPTLDKNYAVQNEQDTLKDAVSLIGEYLKDEPWLKLLCGKLRIDLQEATRKVTAHDILPTATESSPGSSHSLPVKSGSDKKTSNSAKQAKKMKTETGSHNIQDMFRRSSRKKS